EARFALRLTARLEVGAQSLPHDIGERLRVARMQALAQARHHQAVANKRPQAEAAPGISIVGIDARTGTATLGRMGGPGESVWWSRLGWLVPTLVLALGLAGLGEWESREQISRAAQIDTELLGDDLPPAAYLDEGFSEFLRQPPEASVSTMAPAEATSGLLASAGS
ncbi:DUF3619 family protein, partial [Sphaerotilus sp.]|uniref:DUF3619 family protein n=1 Tax=Sphaerotilus sp. TaxID=2093942 RepID=UPI0034E1AB5A